MNDLSEYIFSIIRSSRKYLLIDSSEIIMEKNWGLAHVKVTVLQRLQLINDGVLYSLFRLLTGQNEQDSWQPLTSSMHGELSEILIGKSMILPWPLLHLQTLRKKSL